MPQEPKPTVFQQLVDLITGREIDRRLAESEPRAPFGVVAPPKAAAPSRDINLPDPSRRPGSPAPAFPPDRPTELRAAAIDTLQKTRQPVTPASIAAMERRLQGGGL